MNPTHSLRTRLGDAVVNARADEVAARNRAQRLEREAAEAGKAWTRAKLVRERAELWFRADELRRELADVEARAAAIKMPS